MELKIGICKYDLNFIVDDNIRKESREEAKSILKELLKKKDDYKFRELLFEFIIYFEKDMTNQICSQLDFIKYKLKESGIEIDGDDFGNPF